MLPLNLLWIDDDPGITAYASGYLATQGFRVETAADGATGLACALQGGYDIVVLDQGLPDMTGTDVLTRLRRAAIMVPILVLTGQSSLEGAVEATRLGATDYRSKPLVGAPLVAALRTTIARCQPPLDAPTSPLETSGEPDVRPADAARARGPVTERPVAGAIRSCPSRTVLFQQGDVLETLLWIRSGVVKLVRTGPSGRDMVTIFRTAGALLGVPSVLRQQPSLVSAVTVSACELQPVPAPAIGEARTGPALSWLLESQASEVEAMTMRLAELGTLDLRGRLMAVLASLAESSVLLGRDGTRRLPAFTHEDFSAAVGASRQRVTMMLARLEREGLIQKGGGWIFVPSTSGLLQVAAETPQPR